MMNTWIKVIEVPLHSVSLAKHGFTINLHPAARAAYEWLETYPRLIDWNTLPSPLISGLLSQPLLGVMRYDTTQTARGTTKKTPTEFLFYAPIWLARYWPDSQPPEGSLLIHDDESSDHSNERIEKAAWVSALQLMVFSVDSNSIATIRDSLQKQLPTSVSLELFGKGKISDADLCHWSGLSRGTLIQQRQRQRADISLQKQESTLVQLAQPWNPDSE
jgi:hypothetical protein